MPDLLILSSCYLKILGIKAVKNLIDECSITCLISSIYKINSNGLKMEPWGTLEATGSHSAYCPPTTTCQDLFVRKHLVYSQIICQKHVRTAVLAKVVGEAHCQMP